MFQQSSMYFCTGPWEQANSTTIFLKITVVIIIHHKLNTLISSLKYPPTNRHPSFNNLPLQVKCIFSSNKIPFIDNVPWVPIPTYFGFG